jgi:hypothetical protein
VTTLADLGDTDRDLIREAAYNAGSVIVVHDDVEPRNDAAFTLERLGVFRTDIDDAGQLRFELTRTGCLAAEQLEVGR